MKVKLTPSQKIKVTGSASVYKIMKEVLLREKEIDLSKEHFWIVCLAYNLQLLLIELVSFGSASATIVEPTEVFSFALQKKAARLIMVRNHPSGNLTPSHVDKEVTERMAAIGKFVKVPVEDHLIITEEGYYSFADTGLLDQIMRDTHYDLTFKQIDSLKYQMKMAERKAERELRKAVDEKESAEKNAQRKLKKAEEEKSKAIQESKDAEKREKIRTAKVLLKRKMSVAEIAAITGLTKAAILKIK